MRPKKLLEKTIRKSSKKTQKKLIHIKNVPSSCSKQEMKLYVSDSNLSNVCVECEENYELTKEKVD